MNRRLRLAFCAAVLASTTFAQSRPASGGWLDNITITASGTAGSVNNISRTSAEPSRKDSPTYELEVGASQNRQLARNWLLNAGASATWFHVADYELASHFKAGPRINLQHKFGLGPLAPVLQFDAALAYKSARLDDDRGWTTEAGARLGKRFTSEFKAGIGTRWIEHSARNAVFDLNQHSFSIDATWDINERWSLSGSAGRLSGDIVANATWAVWGQAISGGLGATVFDYYTSRPWKVTHLYGDGWVSYNVEADVDLWSLAVAYAFSNHTSAELRYSSAFVVNKIGIRYPTDSWGLGVTHRF